MSVVHKSHENGENILFVLKKKKDVLSGMERITAFFMLEDGDDKPT